MIAIKYGYALFIVGPLIVSYFVIREKMSASKTSAEFIFPQPTGQHAVGTKLFELTDSSRNDPETNQPRKLVVQVWYPSTFLKELRRAGPVQGKSETEAAQYSSETREWYKRMFAQQGVSPEKIGLLDGIRTHTIPEVPACIEQAPYPVVLFAHGNGAPRGAYSFLCEEIASHGYVVIMVMHTYKVDPLRETKVCAVIEECFADIQCMLNQAKLGAFGALTILCDFNTIGMVGHSLGGIMTAQLCRRDTRIKAGISLDAPLWGINPTKPFNKPFLFIRTPNFYEDMRGVLEYQKELLQAVGVTKENFNGSIERFCRENGKDTQQIVVEGANHMTFMDYPIVYDFFARIFGPSGDVSALKAANELPLPAMLDAIRGCIVTFLNQHLKGQKIAYSSSVQHDADDEDFEFYIPDKHPKHLKIAMSHQLLDAYVGDYQFGDTVFRITKDGSTLYTQIAGQIAYPIYPESETTFFYTAADIQLSFVKDKKGTVTKLVMHQVGKDHEAEKVA